MAFEIEDLGDAIVKLTVIHDDFDPDSTAVTMVSQGGPGARPTLKTLLETGDVLEGTPA